MSVPGRFQQPRTKEEKIARLRRRIEQLGTTASPAVVAILKGMLDLLEDEL